MALLSHLSRYTSSRRDETEKFSWYIQYLSVLAKRTPQQAMETSSYEDASPPGAASSMRGCSSGTSPSSVKAIGPLSQENHTGMHLYRYIEICMNASPPTLPPSGNGAEPLPGLITIPLARFRRSYSAES
jgi:hypothetical protein